MNVGTDGNTAALAVESVRRWWNLVGRAAYPGATRLLVTCDAGGSNGHSSRAWKTGLAELAAGTGLEITVCHFPPGTSKWSKIEHRLFCQITLGWRGRPLTSYDVIITTIGAVTTRTGLAVTAVLDENPYPTGLQISDQQMKDLEDRALNRHRWHGEWNYTLLAAPRPAPEPKPGPPPRPDLGALADPAVTGIPRHDFAAVAAAVENPLGRRPRAAPPPRPRRTPRQEQRQPRPPQAQPPRRPDRRGLPLPPRHDLRRHRRPPRRRPLLRQRRHPQDRRHPRRRPAPHPPEKPTIHQMAR